MQEGVDLLLHLGDIGTVEVIDALAVNRPDDDTQLESRLVFGNTDWDQRSLAEYAEDLGVVVDDPMGRIALPDGVLAYCHGHREHDLEQAMAERVRYLCHGHTHRTLDTRRGPTRVINPGALFRASRYTVAVLDTERDELSFFPIGER